MKSKTKRLINGWAGALLVAASSNTAVGTATTAPLAETPLQFDSPYPGLPPAGTQTIAVHCSGGGSNSVSFGMPFPRGLLRSASSIRVETPSGLEVPSDISELARWRHLTNPTIDRTSIRAAFITFTPTCGERNVVTYQVRWGSSHTKTAGLGVTPESVSTQWRPKAPPEPDENPATDNYQTDPAAVTIREPTVWVTLPANWLVLQNIRGPLAVNNDPMIREYWLGFGATYVNDAAADVTSLEVKDDGRGLIDWSGEIEGWLYDRPFCLWNLYFQTGDVKWMRRAHRAAQYYASFLAGGRTHSGHAPGSFVKRPLVSSSDEGDPKYSLASGLFADYLLTGDAALLGKIRDIGDFLLTHVSTRLPPAAKTDGLWTERNLGAALAGIMYAYEATGDLKYKQAVLKIVAGMREDIAHPPPGYPQDMRGILLHRPDVHEGDHYADWIMSPWMSALLGETLWHYYLISDDPVALDMIGDYAQFIAERSIYNDPNSQALRDYYYPYYISGIRGGHSPAGPSEDCEHAYDVMGLLLRGRWARLKVGKPTALLNTQIVRLRATAITTFKGWKRAAPFQPRFRLAPTRKFAWWFGTTADSAWFLAQVRDAM